MPDRPARDLWLDILEEADLVAAATVASNQSAFVADLILQRAVLHMLQTIGEATGRLQPEELAKLPDIRWQDIRGMRNRIVHGYFGLDMGAVWLTATTEVPALAAAIRAAGLD